MGLLGNLVRQFQSGALGNSHQAEIDPERRILYFCPDYALPSGGTKVLYRHVFQLRRLGFDAHIVHTRKDFRLTWHGYHVPVLCLEDRPSIKRSDVLVFPEPMVDLIKQTQPTGSRRILFPLNWAGIYSNLPSGEDWRDYGIQFVMTPSPVIKEFVEWSMGLDVTLIDEFIDGNRFRWQPERKREKISYISRKSAVGDVLQRILQRKAGPASHYQWVPLFDLSEDEYADQLAESQIYLAVTALEGANISVLEAMASGCLVIGFSGVGGRAFMIGEGPKQNCLLVENEDLPTFGKVIEETVSRLRDSPGAFDTIIQNGIACAGQFHDLDREAQCLGRFFRRVMS